jgi:hypothetical protein
MGMFPPPFTGEEASKAMLDGLISRVREGLRQRILESIEPDITAAVDAGVESLKVAIQSYRDYAGARDVVHILIERRDTDIAKPSGMCPNQTSS